MLNSYKNSHRISSIVCRRLHFKSDDIKMSIKYDFLKNPTKETLNNFEKEYFPTHWVHKYLPRPDIWIVSGEQAKVFDFDKDTELGRYSWNSNGCYPNRICNLLYRSPAYFVF